MKSLRSTAVPAPVVAAFCKKLCRSAMRSSPATALFVIPLVTELVTYHPSLYPLLQVEDKEDVYDVVSVRKALPGVEEEDEAEVMKRKQRAGEWVDDEDDEDEDEEESVIESDDDENGEEKRAGAKKMEEENEVVAEVDDRKPVPVRSTAVLSSEIVQTTLKRMERKRQQLESHPELPEKLPHIEYSFRSRSCCLPSHIAGKEMLSRASAFDPYDETKSVSDSGALESYLWELHVLLHHYDPNVVEMMRKLQTKLLRTRQQFNGVVNVTYATEFARLLRAEPGQFAPAQRTGAFLRGGVLGAMFV